MAKNVTSFRIDANDIEKLKQLGYESASFALEHVMDGYFTLRKVILHSLKGIFNREEIIALTDKQNGMLLTPDYQASVDMFLHGLSDFEMLEGGVTRHEADYKALEEKIKQLNPAQVYFLQEEIDRFWNAPGAYGSPHPDLDKLVEFFS